MTGVLRGTSLRSEPALLESRLAAHRRFAHALAVLGAFAAVAAALALLGALPSPFGITDASFAAFWATAAAALWIHAVLFIRRSRSLHEALLAGARLGDERLADVLEAIPTPVFVKEESTGRYVACNAAFAARLGLDRADVVGKTVHDISKPKDAALYDAMDHQLYEWGGVQRYAQRLVGADGEEKHVLFVKSVIGEEPEQRRIVGVVTDITDLRRAEQEADAARRTAEEASEAKSRFLAAMSHEIRTPLHAVIGMADVLQGTPLTGEQRECLETIATSSDALLRVVGDVLDFSQVESDRARFLRDPLRIWEVIEQALDVLAPAAVAKRLVLTYEIEPNVPEWIRGDAGHLRQLLLNLVGNAVKFTNEGEVVVTVRLQRDGEHLPAREGQGPAPTSPSLIISVRDTGVGMTPEEMARIFDPFSQADQSTSRRFGGAGLGLAISLKLAQRMGGTIWVESEPAKGSTFSFSVPNDPIPEMPTSEFLLPGRSALADRTLLGIVKDEANARIVRTLAGLWGLDATVVSTHEEALSVMDAQGVPDLLVVSTSPIACASTCAPVERFHRFSRGRRAVTMRAFSEGAAVNCRDITISTPLPLRPARLHAALLEALRGTFADGRPSPTERHESTSPADSPLVEVLVVEDNLINQRVAKRMLETLPVRVSIASSGSEALQFVEERAFDLVFMDVRMPGMDGIEATRRIRALPQAVQPRIVAMTADALAETRDLCLAAGMNGYLTKPLVSAALGAVVEEVIASRVLAT